MINKELREQVEKVFEKLADHEDCRAVMLTYIDKDSTVATMASGTTLTLSALLGSLEADILCKAAKEDREHLRGFIKSVTDLFLAKPDIKDKGTTAADGLELLNSIVDLLKKFEDKRDENAD